MSLSAWLRSRRRRFVLVAVASAIVGSYVATIPGNSSRTQLSSAIRLGTTLAYPGDPVTPTSWVVQARDDSRISLVPGPARDASAIRLQVLPGDTNVAGSGSTGERADVWVGTETTDGYEGHEQWWAWSTMFPADAYHPSPTTGWNLFLDFHNTGTTGQANVEFLVNTKFETPMLEMAVYGGKLNSQGKGFLFSPLWENMWLNFVLHVTWSTNPRVGFVELFVDGRLAVPKTYLATLYDGQDVYLKLANYRLQSSEPSTILHAGVRRATSYAEAIQGFPRAKWPRKVPTRSWLSRVQTEG